MITIENKTAIITGASRGIGAAAARHLANLGAKVVLAARSHSDTEEVAADTRDAGGQAVAKVCDVSDHKTVAALIEFANETFSSVDILVNNAGLIDPISRIADSDPDRKEQPVNLDYRVQPGDIFTVQDTFF